MRKTSTTRRRQVYSAIRAYTSRQIFSLFVQRFKTWLFVTRTDICEDLEMRARIAQLVTEREARARVSNGSGGPGSRRGTGGARPSSSRAHSVRRTSLRERGLTAKHDAHEEVRMRNTFTGAAQPNTVMIVDSLNIILCCFGLRYF